MLADTFTTELRSDVADQLVTATRTAVGDSLRSVIYFTPSAFDVLYVRQDLYDTHERAREAKAKLVDMETVGFAEVPLRDAITGDERAAIGPYEFTVRFHRDGFVTRFIQGDVGVLLTTDSMDVTAFEEAVASVRKILAD
jgi:hypothetical protein